MLSAITYLTLGALLAGTHDSGRIKAFFIGLAIFVTLTVGLTRVYLGAHYPTDVLAGLVSWGRVGGNVLDGFSLVTDAWVDEAARA